MVQFIHVETHINAGNAPSNNSWQIGTCLYKIEVCHLTDLNFRPRKSAWSDIKIISRRSLVFFQITEIDNYYFLLYNDKITITFIASLIFRIWINKIFNQRKIKTSVTSTLLEQDMKDTSNYHGGYFVEHRVKLTREWTCGKCRKTFESQVNVQLYLYIIKCWFNKPMEIMPTIGI